MIKPIIIVIIAISFIVKFVFIILQNRKLRKNYNENINKPEYVYRFVPILIDLFPLISIGALMKNLAIGLPVREDNPDVLGTTTFWNTLILVCICIFIQVLSSFMIKMYCKDLSTDEKLFHHLFSFIAVIANAYLVFYLLWSLEKHTWIDFIFIGSNPLGVDVDDSFYEICMDDSVSMVLDSLIEPYESMYLLPYAIGNMIHFIYLTASFCALMIIVFFAVADKKNKPSSIVLNKTFWLLFLFMATPLIMHVKMVPSICFYLLFSILIVITINGDIDTAYEYNIVGINGLYDDKIQKQKEKMSLRKIYPDLPPIDKLKIHYFPGIFVINIVFVALRVGFFLIYRI